VQKAAQSIAQSIQVQVCSAIRNLASTSQHGAALAAQDYSRKLEEQGDMFNPF